MHFMFQMTFLYVVQYTVHTRTRSVFMTVISEMCTFTWKQLLRIL